MNHHGEIGFAIKMASLESLKIDSEHQVAIENKEVLGQLIQGLE
jgi:hypothetical protein